MWEIIYLLYLVAKNRQSTVTMLQDFGLNIEQIGYKLGCIQRLPRDRNPETLFYILESWEHMKRLGKHPTQVVKPFAAHIDP